MEDRCYNILENSGCQKVVGPVQDIFPLFLMEDLKKD
jgi:hypothetical protein